MKTRIITAIIGITIGIIVMILSNTVLYPIVVAAIAGMSVYEILHACGCGVNKYPGHFAMCIAFAVTIPLLTWFDFIGDIWRLLAASVIVFLMFAGYVADHKRLPFDKLAVMVTTTCLITLSVTCLVSLKNMSSVHGISYVIMALMAAWIPDGGAYFVGGLVVTVIVFILYAMGYKYVMHLNGIDFEVNYLLLSIVMMIATPISMVGDLSASLLKREYGIKDYGKILPGHGGIVDRFDSVYFVLPYIMLVFNAFGQNIFVSSVS